MCLGSVPPLNSHKNENKRPKSPKIASYRAWNFGNIYGAYLAQNIIQRVHSYLVGPTVRGRRVVARAAAAAPQALRQYHPRGGRVARRRVAASHRDRPRARRHPGRAVQVDPIKPKLKLPGATRLKLKLNCDILLPTSVLEFNLRRYIQEKRDQLPVNEFKTEILAQVAAHQVVLIAGATGCGKTTQVGPGS